MVVADEGDAARGRLPYERDGFWAGPTAEQLNFVARDKCSLDLLWLKDELEFPFATRYVRAVPGVSPPK